MRLGWECGLGMVAVGFSAGMAWGQTGTVASSNVGKTPASVSFLFDRPGLMVPHFLLTVREDGTGRYEADEAPENGGAGRHIDRVVPVSAATVAKIFEAARAEKDFNVTCASKIKNLADTGKKTLTYAGPDGSGSCLYNFSENKNVQMLTETFQAMAFTMDEGRRLEFKKRFDRLGLDAEMDGLLRAVEQKQAMEMGTIAGILTQIANDTELMQRVRLRAAKLLELSQNVP